MKDTLGREFVMRWAITHVNSDGERVLASDGIFEKRDTARADLKVWKKELIRQIYAKEFPVIPNPTRMAVRPCRCTPDGDPIQTKWTK
jgi:hypothetical protein